jgi:uncharacterized protein (UPF0261 family)
VPIAIVGMLDEREEALRLLKEKIEQKGHRALLVDISVGNGAIIPSLRADVSCAELAELAEKVTADGKGKAATAIMADGFRRKIVALNESGELEGIIAITGMTGALISLNGMEALPFGLPKLLISGATGQPVHASQFANYFAVKDITVMNTVVDTVGMNSLVKTLAVNGANAICGMVEGGRISLQEGRPSIAITEFGFCDRGAHYIREILEKDYDLVSFHATGLGDKALLDLVPQGIFGACIDLVPGAFTEYLLGGNRGIAGPDRLNIAANLSIPYIFCPGGFDIISCGPIERKDRSDPLWTSRKLAERKLYLQDAHRVQARMSPGETEYVAVAAAEKLNQYPGKSRVKVVIPLKGFSSISVEGGPLHDPAADSVFGATIQKHLDPAIEVFEVDSDINSPEFASAIARALSHALRAKAATGGRLQNE